MNKMDLKQVATLKNEAEIKMTEIINKLRSEMGCDVSINIRIHEVIYSHGDPSLSVKITLSL